MIALIGPAASTEYAIPFPTLDQQARFDELYDAGRLPELVDPHSFLHALSADFPTPPRTEWSRPRLGMLYWPVVGLAHYAFATYVVDEYVLGQLRAQMTSAGSNRITVRFRDDPDDAAEVGRDVQMRFLSSRPIVRTTSDPLLATDDSTRDVDGWVVTLVDDRYRRLHNSLTAITTTTWASLFGSVSVTVADAVDADYLNPGVRWSAARIAGRSEAWLIDIAAMSVGSRIVSIPGASPQVQRPTAGRASTLASAHTTAVAALRHAGGGPVETGDIAAGQPNSVRVTFGSPVETTPVVVDDAITNPYAWPSTAYLTHWCDAPASSTSLQRTDLAAQFETDWTAWQYGLYDTLYNGFVDAPQSGFCWAVEWAQDGARATTRFVRPPLWFGYLLAPSFYTLDLAVASTTTETRVSDVTISLLSSGQLRLTQTKVVSTNHFTAAGELVNRTNADPTTETVDVSLCNVANYCGGYTLTKTLDDATLVAEYVMSADYTLAKTLDDTTLISAYVIGGAGEYTLAKTLDDTTLISAYVIGGAGEYTLASTLDNATLGATYVIGDAGAYVLASTLDNATLVAAYGAETPGGPDCANATVMTLGTTYSDTLPAAPSERWWKYTAATTGSHKITTSGVDGLNVGILFYRNGSCPTPDIQVIDHFGPPCWDFTVTNGDTLWYKVTNTAPSAPPAAYTIKIETGVC